MRSKFEEKIYKELIDLGFPDVYYEETTYAYCKKVRSGVCDDCASKEVYQWHKYTVDFDAYKEDGTLIHIETKGIFSPTDRIKMLLVKEQHPGIDLRIIFQRDNKIPIRGPKKKKPTSYTEWARFHGFKYAVGEVPASWLS